MSIKRPGDNEDFEALLEEYTSPTQVQSAKRDKESGEKDIKTIQKQSQRPPKEPQKRLDLHQHTVAEALSEVEYFIKRCRSGGLKTIEIVTGKGIHSESGKSKLKDPVINKLDDLQRRGLITGYKWGTVTREWSGSIIVYLA